MKNGKKLYAEICDTQFCNYQGCGTDNKMYKQSKQRL